MKQVLVIGSKRIDASALEPLSAVADYVQEMIEGSARVSHAQVDELIHVLEGKDVRIYIAETWELLDGFDFVWFRGKLTPALNDLAIVTQYLQSKHVPFANQRYADRAPMGKLAQMHVLAKLGLPYPKTVSASAEYLPQAASKELTYPVILKATNAGHGHSNYLVPDEQTLRNHLADEPDLQFIAQTFIPNDGDYRLLFIGEHQQLIIHRKGSEGSHLNNTSQGGNATLVSVADFPVDVLTQARKFAQTSNYQIAGVDVMFGLTDGQPYFLEVNSQPQLMTGAFTREKAELLQKFFLEELSK